MNKIIKIPVILLTLLFSLNVYSQEKDIQVPFKLLTHFILVKVKVNNSPADYIFIVDTGGLTFIDKKLATELKLKQQGMMAKVNELDLNGNTINNIFCFTNFNFDHLKKLGIPIHGIIGSDLLERFKVNFDFRSNIITLINDSSDLKTPENAYYFKFRNHPINNAPIVKFKLNGEEFEGMIDTGQPYHLVFPLNTFEKNKENIVSEYLRSNGLMVKWPNTKADYNYLAKFRNFEFGSLKLNSVTGIYGELPRMLSMPFIGMDLLSRFNITINFPKDEMVLLPDENIKLDENYFSWGFNPDVSEDGKIFILGVLENSPAYNAGIRPNDEIISFNSKNTSLDNMIDLLKMVKDDNIQSVELEIKGKGKIRLEKEHLF
ncbi:PDZ domain-containing protein [candidate division KSB1 bacterium]